MGVVTARAAGRRGDRRRRALAPGHPRRLRALRRRRGPPDGRGAGRRRARAGDRDDRARRRDRRAGQPLRPGGQAPALRPRRDRRLRRARPTCWCSRARAPTRARSRSTCSPRASTARTRWSRRCRTTAPCWTRSAARSRRSTATAPPSRPGRRCSSTRAGSEAALAFAEALAPEHLELIGEAAEALAPRITRAGCVFVGVESATAFGDYVAGSNHTLPTAGAARFASGLHAGHFRRRMSEVRIGDAAAALAEAGVPIAAAEGFAVHAESMSARIRQNRTP